MAKPKRKAVVKGTPETKCKDPTSSRKPAGGISSTPNRPLTRAAKRKLEAGKLLDTGHSPSPETEPEQPKPTGQTAETQAATPQPGSDQTKSNPDNLYASPDTSKDNVSAVADQGTAQTPPAALPFREPAADQSTNGAGSEPSISPQPASYFDPKWSADWLIFDDECESGDKTAEIDLLPHWYRGHCIDDPKRYLILAKDFLADKRIEHSHQWERKFREIGAYLTYLQCTYSFPSLDWAGDLQEALSMLQTHCLYNKRFYRLRKLNLGFSDVRIKQSKRLAPVPGSQIVLSEGFRPPIDCLGDGHRTSAAKAGIFFEPPRLDQVPEEAFQDPFAYTKGAIWLKHEALKWAQWWREHVSKEAWYRGWPGTPVLPPASSWMGPVVLDGLNRHMRKTRDTFREYTRLHQRLIRASHRSRVTRSVLSQALLCIGSGFLGEDWRSLSLRFRYDELSDGDKTDLVKIRPDEVEWLEYLCQDIPNMPRKGVEELTPTEKFLLERVNKSTDDPRLKTSLGILQPEDIYDVQGAVNSFVSEHGSVNQVSPSGYQLNCWKIWDYSKILEATGILRCVSWDSEVKMMYADSTRKREVLELRHLIARSIPKSFPEEAIHWADSEFLQGIADDGIAEDEIGVAITDDASTASDHITTVSTEEDFEDYQRHLPSKKNLRSYDELGSEIWPESDRERTLGFYSCLGYRFGRTMRLLQEEHRQNMAELAKNPQKGEANDGFQRGVLRFWMDDYVRHIFNVTRDTWRGKQDTPFYKDIVRAAEPAEFDESWTSGIYTGEEEAVELVRKGIIMEAHENKPLLWPRKAGEAADELGSKFPGWRRESLWTFAQPSIRPKAKHFFSINRWPLHLQTKERQEEIMASGPEVVEAKSGTQPTVEATETCSPSAGGVFPRTCSRHLPAEGQSPEEDQSSEDDQSPKEARDEVQPYWLDALRLEEHRNGTEFWMGDTPRQQKAVINGIRRRLEAPKPSTWGEWVTGFFGRKRRRDDDLDDEHLRLPSPQYMPKIEYIKSKSARSRAWSDAESEPPRKIQRAESPEEEARNVLPWNFGANPGEDSTSSEDGQMDEEDSEVRWEDTNCTSLTANPSARMEVESPTSHDVESQEERTRNKQSRYSTCRPGDKSSGTWWRFGSPWAWVRGRIFAAHRVELDIEEPERVEYRLDMSPGMLELSEEFSRITV